MSAAQDPEAASQNPPKPDARPEEKPKPAQRALAKPPSAVARSGSRAADVARTVLPLVQKVLPLLEGNVAGAVANLLAPGTGPSGSRVDLQPMEHALARQKVENRELRSLVEDQAQALERLSGALEELKSAAERDRREREEAARELAKVRKRLKVLAWVSLSLLAVCMAAIAVLAMRIFQP